MKVNVEYSSYDSSMLKAIIPVDTDKNISLEIVEDTSTSPSNHKLKLLSEDSTLGSNIELSMNKVEVRELIVLLSKFQTAMK